MRISDWSSDVCSPDLRLAKLDAGDYDAIVLACAGLQRLGFGERIRARLDAPDWLPAPAQGAIAIECRDDDARTIALCAVLDDAHTRTCVEAERAMNRALHGSCRSEEHTSELPPLIRPPYAVFSLKKTKKA